MPRRYSFLKYFCCSGHWSLSIQTRRFRAQKWKQRFSVFYRAGCSEQVKGEGGIGLGTYRRGCCGEWLMEQKFIPARNKLNNKKAPLCRNILLTGMCELERTTILILWGYRPIVIEIGLFNAQHIPAINKKKTTNFAQPSRAKTEWSFYSLYKNHITESLSYDHVIKTVKPNIIGKIWWMDVRQLINKNTGLFCVLWCAWYLKAKKHKLCGLLSPYSLSPCILVLGRPSNCKISEFHKVQIHQSLALGLFQA